MKTIRLLNRTAAAVAAALVLVAANGALAKGNNGGDHDHGQNHSDYSQMKSHDSKSDHSDKHSEKHKDKSGEMRSENHKDKDSKHAEKTKDKDKDKTTATTTTANGTPAAGSDKDLFGKGVVGRTPTDIKPVPGTPASGAAPGPTAVNTIHPIPSPPPRTVTISNGTTTDQIPDGAGGVTVTSQGPGTITVSNGVQSATLHGIKMTISGSVGVGVPKSIGTGPRQADGSTVVLSPNGTVTGGPAGGNIVDGILTAINPPVMEAPISQNK